MHSSSALAYHFLMAVYCRTEARRPSLKMYYPCFACVEILPTMTLWSKHGGNGDQSEWQHPGSILLSVSWQSCGMVLDFRPSLGCCEQGPVRAQWLSFIDTLTGKLDGDTLFCLKCVSVFCLKKFTWNFKESVILQLILPMCWRCLDACIVFL